MKEKNREPWVAQVLLREIHVCTHTHRVFVAYWRDPPSPNCRLRNWLTAGSTQPLLQPFCFILLLTTILESNSIHVQDYMRQSVMRQRQKCLSFDSLRPMDYSSPDLSMEYSGKNTRLGRHFLLQGIFLNHGSNPSLLQCRQILYCLSHQGSPCLLQSVSFVILPIWPCGSVSRIHLASITCALHVPGTFWTEWPAWTS